ncbi:hypothetical protein ACJX0J_023844, partial [Zea mays]
MTTCIYIAVFQDPFAMNWDCNFLNFIFMIIFANCECTAYLSGWDENCCLHIFTPQSSCIGNNKHPV